ncbi:MAG TPA: hypothetical protein VIY52_11080 [Streptosporangiaceae bacterium]
MNGMSVNEVPGWFVAMAPRAIGVPVAATPGLVPHCEVLTVAVLALAELVALELVGGVLEVLLLGLLLLLQAAVAMAIATAAASTSVLRADGRFRCVLIYPPQGGEFFQLS